MTATAPAAKPAPKTIDVDRDTASAQCNDWPMRPLSTIVGTRENKFQVVFSQSAMDEIHVHGQGHNDIEVCGVLIGNGYRDDNGPYLLVEHCIRGNGARARSTNVTFTAETWAFIQDAMDRDHPDKKMVGWYHTHPGFGIFLSDMDVFICDNFFNLPWQVAFVYDPLSGDEGNFVWRAGKPTREGILIEDDVTPLAAKIPLITREETLSERKSMTAATIAGMEANANSIELLIRVRRLEKRQKKLIIGMVFLASFVIIWAVEFSAVPMLKNVATTQPSAVTTPPNTTPLNTTPPNTAQPVTGRNPILSNTQK